MAFSNLLIKFLNSLNAIFSRRRRRCEENTGILIENTIGSILSENFGNFNSKFQYANFSFHIS
jgi:hypothetical protein